MERSEARATIRDVARKAGVGTMTVSRVVTGTGYVSSETRTKVEEAITALGYLPNQHARGLRSRKSGTIALIISDLTNPYFTTLASGVEEATRVHGDVMLVASTDETEEEELRCMSLLLQKGVDGVILVPSHQGEKALESARKRGIPCVVADRKAPPGFDCVRSDSESGAASLAQTLLESGHRTAAVLAAEPGVSTSDDRVRGFVGAFETAGASALIERGKMTVDWGRALARKAVERSPRPTCLFAVNNFLMIGALQALQEMGCRVPGDLSVVGFDDLPSSMLAFPFLTVASQPARQLGRLACERLYLRLENPDLPTEDLVLSVEVLVRGSVSPPPCT